MGRRAVPTSILEMMTARIHRLGQLALLLASCAIAWHFSGQALWSELHKEARLQQLPGVSLGIPFDLGSDKFGGDDVVQAVNNGRLVQGLNNYRKPDAQSMVDIIQQQVFSQASEKALEASFAGAPVPVPPVRTAAPLKARVESNMRGIWDSTLTTPDEAGAHSPGQQSSHRSAAGPLSASQMRSANKLRPSPESSRLFKSNFNARLHHPPLGL